MHLEDTKSESEFTLATEGGLFQDTLSKGSQIHNKFEYTSKQAV